MEIVGDPSLWGGFALEQNTAKMLSARLGVLTPESIVEFGSGSSTLLFADYARRHGSVKVVSLEHNPEYAARTKLMLKQRGLERHVKLITCGLTGANWYDWWPKTSEKVDFVLVDGPPGDLNSRREALPAMWTWLAPEFELWLDDAQRPNERAALDWWTLKFPVEVDHLDGRIARVRRAQPERHDG